MRSLFFLVITLTSLTNSSASAIEFSADMITQVIGQQKSKIYYKNSETHRSETMGIINIVNGPMVYQVVPETMKYTVQKQEDLQEDNPAGTFGDVMALIKKNNMKKTGKEEIQGYQCVVYEGTVQFSQEHPPAPMKIWYAKKLDTMIKQEISLGPPMGSVVTQLENIKIGKQDASLFEVPEGYAKVDSIHEAMGMGAFKLPAMDAEGGQMPSSEDMEKMMQQMQEMMKQTQ